MNFLSPVLAALALFTIDPFKGEAAELLVPGEPMAIAGTHGRFDFLTIDTKNHRLLAAHTGNGSLDVIDLDKKAVAKVLPLGAAQSSAVGTNSEAYYVSVSKPPQLVIVNASTLEIDGTIPLAGPADLLAFHAKSGQVYVGHDDGKELWVVDPATKKVAGAIELPGEAPEDIYFDAKDARLFQAMKIGNIVAVVDVGTGKVIEKWPTAPAEAPHGMAIVPETEGLLVAGGNGKLVLLSQKDGHVISSADIAKSVDQIAYDPELHRVYCASSTGKISVVKVEPAKLILLGAISTSPGAKSIVLDAKTHAVWIAYAKGEASFVQPFATEVKR